jgi:hypothetical protein
VKLAQYHKRRSLYKLYGGSSINQPMVNEAGDQARMIRNTAWRAARPVCRISHSYIRIEFPGYSQLANWTAFRQAIQSSAPPRPRAASTPLSVTSSAPGYVLDASEERNSTPNAQPIFVESANINRHSPDSRRLRDHYGQQRLSRKRGRRLIAVCLLHPVMAAVGTAISSVRRFAAIP